MPIYRLTLLISTVGEAISIPWKIICPAEGFSRRLQQRMSVLLPEPEGPIMTSSSLRVMFKSIPLRTSLGPKDFLRPLMDRIEVDKICSSFRGNGENVVYCEIRAFLLYRTPR